MNLLSLIPALSPTHWSVMGGAALVVAAVSAGGAAYVTHKFDDGAIQAAKEQTTKAVLACQTSVLQAKQAADKIIAERQAAADAQIQKVANDVQQSEQLRIKLAAQVAALQQQNSALADSLSRTGRALQLQRAAVAHYAAGSPGQDTAACAGADGRARAVGQLFDQGSQLLSEGLGLLQEGIGLLGEGGQVQSDLAAAAERYATIIRDWQSRERTVVQVHE